MVQMDSSSSGIDGDGVRGCELEIHDSRVRC